MMMVMTTVILPKQQQEQQRKIVPAQFSLVMVDGDRTLNMIQIAQMTKQMRMSSRNKSSFGEKKIAERNRLLMNLENNYYFSHNNNQQQGGGGGGDVDDLHMLSVMSGTANLMVSGVEGERPNGDGSSLNAGPRHNQRLAAHSRIAPENTRGLQHAVLQRRRADEGARRHIDDEARRRRCAPDFPCRKSASFSRSPASQASATPCSSFRRTRCPTPCGCSSS